jgi:hypothetical protein
MLTCSSAPFLKLFEYKRTNSTYSIKQHNFKSSLIIEGATEKVSFENPSEMLQKSIHDKNFRFNEQKMYFLNNTERLLLQKLLFAFHKMCYSKKHLDRRGRLCSVDLLIKGWEETNHLTSVNIRIWAFIGR